MGYVKPGVIYSPTKDLDLALGIIRNIVDSDVRLMQAIVEIAWRFR